MTSKLKPNVKPQLAKKSSSRRSDTPVAKAARHESSRNYRWKNEEEHREKARIQMAKRRAVMKAEGYVSEEHTISTKEAHTAYRAKNRELLASKARVRRQNAFIAKYGIQAHRDRIAKERAREDAAWQLQLAENERQREARQEARKAARQSASTTLN
ncbi:hypothetical protein B0H14DRAFT_3436819 [Mycena olivaceomarginata]|nr:hypothetical protein B0H14DRAFT_3436819 [Mycena olivaceomarginata]